LLAVNNLLYFPLRRICALGVPEEALQAVHAALPHVAISTDGAALQRCDLLLIDSRDSGAMDLVGWIRQRMPHFPVVLWDAAVRPAALLVDQCRRLLFPGDSSAA
jgi:hypothetical protein